MDCMVLVAALLATLAVGGSASNHVRKLEYSTVIWNPGSHTYEHTYRQDPYYGTRIWRHGFGQLTNMGVNDTYKLGQFLRQKYDGFLSLANLKRELNVISTDSDMTVSSALALLAGLYPIQTYDQWNSAHTTWRPVPIRTFSREAGESIHLPIKGNAEYAAFQDLVFNSDWMKAYEAKHADFFKEARRITEEDWNMKNIYKLADNLFTVRLHALPVLTDWEQSGLLDTLKELNSVHMGSLFTDKEGRYTVPIAKLQGGVLLNKIVRAMKKNIFRPKQTNLSNTRVSPLMTAYSVPTTTLVGLLVSLGAYEWSVPEAASLLMFDVYHHNGTYEIDVSYRNGDSSTKILEVHGCKQKCPFDQFENIARNFAASDIGGDDTEDDGGADNFSTCDGLLLGFIGTLFIMSFLSIGVVLYLLRRPVSPNPSEFERLE